MMDKQSRPTVIFTVSDNEDFLNCKFPFVLILSLLWCTYSLVFHVLVSWLFYIYHKNLIIY